MFQSIRTAVALLLVALLSAGPTHAQFQDANSLDNLSEALKGVTGTYADSYVQPVSDAFGAGMNSALFRTADAGGGILPKIDIYVGVSVTGTLMARSNRTFLPMDGEAINLANRTVLTEYTGGAAPTAFGSTNTPDAQVQFRDEQTGLLLREDPTDPTSAPVRLTLPPGVVDTPVAPLIIPQIGAGTAFGTDVMLRYLPKTRLKSYGTIGVFGLGIRHSISQYIPMSPVDLAVQGVYNSVTLEDQALEGDVLDASGYAINLQASKSLPVLPVTFYGGLQYETFSAEYAYEFDPASFSNSSDIDPVSFTLDQDASNSVRGLAGVSITLAVVRINADYSLAANDVVTLGIGVQL